jgi:hypothetical protein
MDNNNPWPLAENPFDNRTKRSRKAMHKIGADHKDKLDVKAATSAFFASLQGLYIPIWTNWTAAYNAWVNANAAWNSCTRKLEGMLDTLRVDPPGEGRSLIDQWEGAIAGLWSRTGSMYEYFFPQGREPFTEGTRESTIQAVATLSTRLIEKTAIIQSERANLELQLDALVAAGATVPDELQDAVQLARDREATVTRLGNRINAFAGSLQAARSEQQGCEGTVALASSALDKQRVRLARRLLKNFYLIADHHCDVEAPEPNPQFAAADYFDLATLMRPNGEGDDGEEEPPAPVPPPPAP